jgi:hypothetical protein
VESLEGSGSTFTLSLPAISSIATDVLEDSRVIGDPNPQTRTSHE